MHGGVLRMPFAPVVSRSTLQTIFDGSIRGDHEEPVGAETAHPPDIDRILLNHGIAWAAGPSAGGADIFISALSAMGLHFETEWQHVFSLTGDSSVWARRLRRSEQVS